MKYKENKVELFQASSFRVDDMEAFLANEDVKHVIRVMGFNRLPYRSKGDSIAISLPPNSFHTTAFDDDEYKVDKMRLLATVDAIEEHIAEGEFCNFTYVNVMHGEFADTYTGVIRKGETTDGTGKNSRKDELQGKPEVRTHE